MVNPTPAIELINQQLIDDLPKFDRSLLIGIDGNEANIQNRVGSNMYAYQLLKALSNADSPHRFVVFLKQPPLEDMPHESTNWKYRIIPFAKFWSHTRLPIQLLLTRNRPDVFFVPGHYVSSLAPMPVVITILDLAFLTHPKYFTSSDLFKLRSWTQAAASKAKHILTISQSTRQDIVDYYDIPSRQITVTYPGIDHNRFFFPQSDQDINQIKQKYRIKDEYVLYVGTLQPRKNLVNLIKAFAKVERPNYQLVIAGKKGWMYQDIFKITQKLNLQDQVIFTDFVPDSDLPSLMAGARCLALVSLYEGFGIPVVEAQAVGTPAIISNVSSLPEILGGAGYKINPDDISSITQNLRKMIDLTPEEYYQLAETGINHSHAFDWQHTAKVTLQAIEQTANP